MNFQQWLKPVAFAAVAMAAAASAQAQTVLKIGYATAANSHYGVGSTVFCDEIAKGIIEAHGGRIWAENRAGGGAVDHSNDDRRGESRRRGAAGAGAARPRGLRWMTSPACTTAGSREGRTAMRPTLGRHFFRGQAKGTKKSLAQARHPRTM